jgi:hypothetical protein
MSEDLGDKSCGGWMNGLCIGGLELSRGKTDDRRQESFAAGRYDLPYTGFCSRDLRRLFS